MCSGYTPQNCSGYHLSVPYVNACWVSKTDVQLSVPYVNVCWVSKTDVQLSVPYVNVCWVSKTDVQLSVPYLNVCWVSKTDVQLSVPYVNMCWMSKTRCTIRASISRGMYHNLFLYMRCDVERTTAEKGECPGCFFYVNVLVADWIM